MDIQLDRFFAAYAARFNRALGNASEADDVEATAAAFASCFMEAGPHGVSCGRNDEQFRARIPKGYEFYRNIGTRSMRIVSLATTPLDSLHSMAKVGWEATYEKRDGTEDRIDFEVIYLVQTITDEPQIFAYITGDEQKILRERGLIPG